MEPDGEVPDTPAPLPWLELLVGVACVTAFLVLISTWVVWLLNHRMGPFPTWLTVTVTACSAILTSGRVLLWFAGRTHSPDDPPN